jgi:[acyl-carrier-protein] S-malonyltransferase
LNEGFFLKRLAFIFPGQGSQSFGMGKDFYDNFPVVKEMIQSASDRLSIDFKSLLFEENDLLEQTQFTQPAILLVSSIAHKLFENELPVKPVFTLGHSLGEFSSLVAAKALDVNDAVEVVHNRGKFMAQACEGKEASMLVVLGLNDETVEKICFKAQSEGKLVWAANYNVDGQIVIAGAKADLQTMESIFKDAGAKRAMLLNMSVASHCPMIEPAVPKLQEYLEKYIKDEFICNVISNVTASPYSTKQEAIELLLGQLTKPVKYKQSILSYENDVDMFIEFGGGVLKGLNRKITSKPTISITDALSLEKACKEIQ